MLKPKQILVKIGPQHLGKGVSYVLAELDKAFPAFPVKPSLIGNIALTVAGFIGGFLAPAPLDEVLAIWGGFHSTNLWDYLQAGVAPAVRLSNNPGFTTSLQPYAQPGIKLVPTRPGTSTPTDIAHRKVNVGPYAGGGGAPKFIPGILRPKFMHGA